MEGGESIGGMEVCSGFPRVVADAVALPLDEVMKLATHDPAVENADTTLAASGLRTVIFPPLSTTLRLPDTLH